MREVPVHWHWHALGGYLQQKGRLNSADDTFGISRRVYLLACFRRCETIRNEIH